jgi:sulfatase modifying factor 1
MRRWLQVAWGGLVAALAGCSQGEEATPPHNAGLREDSVAVSADASGDTGPAREDGSQGSAGQSDASDGEASASDSEAAGGSPASCLGLASTCGQGSTDDCCASLPVPGGTFYRGYDGVTFTDRTHPATVSDFRLDKYEVTVGRFRPFVAALNAGWRPADGAGKHSHLNGGKGLLNVGDDAGAVYESGWSSSFDVALPANAATFAGWLACDVPTTPPTAPTATWTPSPGANENRPINCVNQTVAYAFCIWDGGFLPSEAEWNYAASGGSEQRAYPWSSPATSTVIDDTYAVYSSPSTQNVGAKPLGVGKWGHEDLAGNVWEWTLDYSILGAETTGYADPCTDCVYLPSASGAAVGPVQKRGGSFFSGASGQASVLISSRWPFEPDLAPGVPRGIEGLRCARAP